jgi:hypothetical protein
MSHYFAGVLTGIFVGGMAGYFTAINVFNRSASRVAKYVLQGRQQAAKVGR